jgi:Ca-activated chloride channel family protein
MRVTSIFARLFCLSIALFVIESPASPQEQKPSKHPAQQELSDDDVVRVSTNLVTVPVSVMDRQGRFIADLSQGQFHLYENGVEQDIAYFESAEKPFTVALLLDTSDSTKFKLKDIQDAAIAFTEQLRPDDRVMVAAFDKRVAMLTEATSDRRALHEAIRRAQTGGGTSLYNAVEIIVGERLNRIRGRKAIVLFTDGVDTTSLGATYEGTLHMAQELDALAYAIQYNTYDDVMLQSVSQGQMMGTQVTTSKGESLQTAYARANRYLNLMADRTGGRFYYADTVKRLTEVFTHIAQELRQQYSIGYYPKNQLVDAEQRQIKVRVSLPSVVVRARRSYVFKPSTGNPRKD